MVRHSAGSESIKVDEKGRKLLARLAQEGRASATSLGKQLRLSREVVAYRIQRLQEQGVIERFIPIVQLQKLGYQTYYVYFLLNEQLHVRHKALIDHIKAHPNTLAVTEYSDTWDIGWKIAAHSLGEFDALVRAFLTDYSDVIVEKQMFASVKTYLTRAMPLAFAQSAAPRDKQPDDLPVVIDALDRSLLEQLDKDARASSTAIGPAIKTSSDTVLARMRKLEESGVIERYAPVINLAALGYSWYTYVMQFTKFDTEDERRLIEFVSQHPHIIRAVRIFGSTWDIMLHIVVQDSAAYHATTREVKQLFSHSIRRYETWLLYNEYCYTTMPPVFLQGK